MVKKNLNSYTCKILNQIFHLWTTDDLDALECNQHSYILRLTSDRFKGEPSWAWC